MAIFVVVFYGLFAFVSVTNLLLMKQPVGDGDTDLAICIPCRNEAKNIGGLIRYLRASDPNLRIVVFDDDSTDETARIAIEAGAEVIASETPLPEGWTGKNRGCFELGNYVENEWFAFVDADIYPKPSFAKDLRAAISSLPPKSKMITGFPSVIPGRGIEPLFLGWVGWILLSTNPFGIVSATGRGHNRFANGQIQVWERQTYLRLQPNRVVRDRILEDVAIGRLCAREGVGVQVLNLTDTMGVKMYETWRETFDGLSKNSFEIAGSTLGSIAIALFLFAAGWLWLFNPIVGAPLFLISAVITIRYAKGNPLLAIFAPFALTIGAVTVIRSLVWHRTGRVTWKGRTYPSPAATKKSDLQADAHADD